ncbi:DUF4258 domain-containing protein [Candidatus Wolfebacteria bacterium]|nr:DUF4258 domain-containing protein [Candidatus Wolfebacteria bacterium]
MKIKFSSHALKRLKERGIKQNDVKKFIESPDKIETSKLNQIRFLIKKIYHNQKYNKEHLLMMICEKMAP